MNKEGGSWYLVWFFLIVLTASFYAYAGVEFAEELNNEDIVNDDLALNASNFDSNEIISAEDTLSSENYILTVGIYNPLEDRFEMEEEEDLYSAEDIEKTKASAINLVKSVLNGNYISTKIVEFQSKGYLNGINLTISGDKADTGTESQNIIVDSDVETSEIIDVSEVVQEPVEESTTVTQTFDVNGVPTEYVKYYDMTATAYCICQKCCGKSPSSPGYGRTASGLVIVPGTGMKIAAVDRSVIPLGTNIYVEGLNGAPNYGFALAADTGGAIKNSRIDLYFDTHQAALKWGRKSVRVYILPD